MRIVLKGSAAALKFYLDSNLLQNSYGVCLTTMPALSSHPGQPRHLGMARSNRLLSGKIGTPSFYFQPCISEEFPEIPNMKDNLSPLLLA